PIVISFSHCDRARQYAEQVLAGTLLACHYVKLACRRQLEDLARFGGSESLYVFDRRQAERVCSAIEGFPHVKGQWARGGERLKLEPWQEFLITTAFGWRVRATGARRFKVCYTEVARKNAKSTLASALGLYFLACDAEPGAVVVSAATTRDQARLCF